jgi:prevent-host-death family protein
MAVFSIQEAESHFSELLERVVNGEEVIITKAGKPVARILPVVTDVSPRKPGNDAGKIIIAPDFDDPLEEFEI